MPNYVPGYGPFEAKLMIIGEAPGRQENEAGRPFVGPTGAMLDEYLTKAGMRQYECYLTNVVKYQPPFNDFTKLAIINVDLAESTRKLWDEEITKIKPNCILAVGDHALEAVTGLTGILKYRGSILTANDGVIKVVPTIHPAALFKREGETGALSFVYSKLIQSDIARAVEESRTRSLDLPSHQLDIARNSLDLFRFTQEYKALDGAASDIESINCVPVCISFAFNKHHAISVPLINAIGEHSFTDMGRRELIECYRLVDELLRRLKLVGQNFKYDEYKLNRIGFAGMNLYSDTLIKTRVLFPELPLKALHVQSSLWTRVPFYKEEGKEQKIGKKFNVERFQKYNGKDSCVTFEIDQEQERDLIEMGEALKLPLRDYYYNRMMPKHKFYLAMENVGFRVDEDKKKYLKSTYEEMRATVHAKLISLTGYEVNVKSYPQMFELLFKAMNFPAMKKNPTSEDTIVRLLGNHCKGKDAAIKKDLLETILEERRIRDQLSRYINFTADFDRRCKTSFAISSTETCRSSTQVIKKPLRPIKLGLAFHTISKHGRLAKDIRSMFIPDEGKVFVQCDSSQAEARIVAVLSTDYELLKAFDIIDIHRRTAALIFGYTSNLNLSPKDLGMIDHMEKDGAERFCGKKTRHACNYDMKKSRFMLEFNTDAQKFGIPMEISEWKAGSMLDTFHAASPKVKGVFHKEIQEALNNTRLLIDPFGGPRIFNGRLDEQLYQEGYANIPQRTVAHLVQGAGVNVSEELNGDTEVYFCSENHDALVLQAPENNWEPYARLLKKHMEMPIDFSTYCTLKRDIVLTIPADVEISNTNYADFKKVKLS